MTYPHVSAKIIADSINRDEDRLTTFELTYSRFVHSEVLTHRAFVRNAQSTRAIPTQKRIDRVRDDPVMPILWLKNQKGMVARDEPIDNIEEAVRAWREGAAHAALTAQKLTDLGLHKQWAGRGLEPYDTITVIVSATSFENFFALRCAEDAQPEIQCLAWRMAEQYYEKSVPVERSVHLPYVTEEEMQMGFTLRDLMYVSAGRCARVSYLSHDGRKKSLTEETDFAIGLSRAGHWTPLEHPAQAHNAISRNYAGWQSLRAILGNDVKSFVYDPSKRPEWTK